MCRNRQCFGSVNISYGSGSAILNFGSGKPFNYGFVRIRILPLDIFVSKMCCQKRYEINKFYKIKNFFGKFICIFNKKNTDQDLDRISELPEPDPGGQFITGPSDQDPDPETEKTEILNTRSVLRIRNKSFGSGFGSGSGLKLVSDSDPVSDPDSNPYSNPDSNPDSNPGFESGSESWIRI